jgi:hypothetical protein
MLAYQVCECTRSTPPSASAIAKSTDKVCKAGFALSSPGATAWLWACGRGPPKQCTSTSHRFRSSGTR